MTASVVLPPWGVTGVSGVRLDQGGRIRLELGSDPLEVGQMGSGCSTRYIVTGVMTFGYI